MHRKWVRLKCVSYFSLDALFCISIFVPMWASLKLSWLSRKQIPKLHCEKC
jgi:hypothetical protein